MYIKILQMFKANKERLNCRNYLAKNYFPFPF